MTRPVRMEVLRQESPVVKQLTVKEQWADTPPVLATVLRRPLQTKHPSTMSSSNKRPSTVAPSSAKAYKKARHEEEEAPVKARHIDDRIRMLFPNDNVIGKVREK